jgi:hypothetical protein
VKIRDKNTKRTKAYTVRYSDIEAAEIQKEAQIAALEVGSWIRMVTVLAARRARAPAYRLSDDEVRASIMKQARSRKPWTSDS